MKTSLSAVFVAFGVAIAMLATAPSSASAQCVSPEHCHNVGEEEQQCFDGASSFAFEDCEEVEGFCQLTGGQCSGPSFEYSDLPADIDMTILGTLKTPASGVFEILGISNFRNCHGIVVQSSDTVESRPSLIVLK